MNLAQALRALYPALNPAFDYFVVAAENGMELRAWDEARLGPRPTEQALAAKMAEPYVAPASPIDGMAFLARFTDPELQAIYAAAASNIQLTRWIEMLRLRGEVHTESDTAMAAKAALVAASLLTQTRADEIFAP